MQTHIENLGADYTVADLNGTVINTIQIITHTEILKAGNGFYNESETTIQSYLDSSIAALDGTNEVDPYRVLWHATESSDIVVSELIGYAVKYGYDKIIIEYLHE